MIGPSAVLVTLVAYLGLLFVVAAYAERRGRAGRSIIANPWVYALSWAVYCTAWTYFGSVGRAAAGGIWFLPIYLGPTLAMTLAWVVLRKMVRIAQSYRITSIADFIASRYGKSPALAAAVTLVTVVGIIPYIALQVKAVSAGYEILAGDRFTPAHWWQDGTLGVTLGLAAFTIVFGTRHLDLSERHEGMVAAVALESLVKLGAFLVVGAYVTWGLFDGPTDIWARAAASPDLAPLMRLGGAAAGAAPGTGFAAAQWFAMTMLAMLSVLLLPRQFQMMVVECVEERHILRAAWVFAAYLLAINLFVLPLAIGGLLIFGPGGADPETFVISLPLAQGATGLALLAYLGGLSAATGMLIVETVAVSTMVCNDLVMPALLRLGKVGPGRGPDVTRLLLNIRRAAIVAVLLLGYVYFRVAGDVYALVSIGLISFAAVAQFAPALLGGIYWRGATGRGAMAGLLGGFAVWGYTLMLPSMVKSGWLPAGILDGPFGIGWLAPERLFGLSGFDNLTHALFWSMLANIGLYVVLSLARPASAREASQAVLFVDVYDRGEAAAVPVFWRGRARTADLMALARRLLGPARADQIVAETGAAAAAPFADARMVDQVERQIAGAIGSASARVMVASVVQEEPLAVADVLEILDEASQIRGYARALEEKSASLEAATAELRAANEALRSLDHMKDEFMSSITHELRTPLTSIRALSELMLDAPDMEEPQRAEFLRIVVAESQRLSRLVNQVLDMAKLESGHADWHSEDVDMRTLVSDAVRATEALFQDRGIGVDLQLPPAALVIRADPDRLTQVVLNLLSNAAKFARARVTVALDAGPDSLTLRVSDDGRGIAPEDQDAVFERFRQVGEAAGHPGGTGLGLPISRRIIEHFGGEIWVDSAPGQGATFAFRLPYDRREGEAR